MQSQILSRVFGVTLGSALALSCSSSNVRDVDADAGGSGQHLYAAKDYLFCEGKVSWFEAKATCGNLGGVLAKLEDEHEAQFVEDTMEQSWSKTHGGAWLGARRVHGDFSGWKGRGDILIGAAGAGGWSVGGCAVQFPG